MPIDMQRGKKSREAARRTRRQKRIAAKPEAAVTVTFRHVEPTTALRDYAQRKLAHLAKFLKRPCEVHLILTVDKYRQHGEVTFKSGAFTVTAQEETKDLYSVIDLLADKVGRQLKRHQEKTATKRVRAASTGEIMTAAELEAEPGREPL